MNQSIVSEVEMVTSKFVPDRGTYGFVSVKFKNVGIRRKALQKKVQLYHYIIQLRAGKFANGKLLTTG